MELRLLRYFLTTIQEQSITRAARKLNISQPALSRQLTVLEKGLGQKLLIRSKRQTMLTPAGEFLRVRASMILELANDTQRMLHAFDAQPPAVPAHEEEAAVPLVADAH